MLLSCLIASATLSAQAVGFESLSECPGERVGTVEFKDEHGWRAIATSDGYRLSGDVYFSFEFDDARVVLSDHERARWLGRFLACHADQSIYLIGSTNEVGSDEYNRHLSMERARSVRALLLRYGASADQIRVIGKGAVQGSENRNQAQRVSVVLFSS